MKPSLLRRALLRALVALALLAPGVTRGSNDCSNLCTQTACGVDCTEADLRDAVAKANACSADSAFTRTITFNCGPGTIIGMQQTSTIGACQSDSERYAVCLSGHHIVIDGESKVTFTYTGAGQCASDQCGTVQPALFTLKGSHNTVKNFAMEYFPEGIILRDASSSSNTVSGVTSDHICDDAITVHEGLDHTVAGNTLTGNTSAGSGHTCYRNDCQTSGPCGVDKAIQVNGGTSTIVGNIINTIGAPVHVAGGAHTIAYNTAIGSTSSQNVCFGCSVVPYPSGAVATVVMEGNSIHWCKWAVRVVDAAVVEANNNTVQNSWLAAFTVRGTGNGRLKGAGNRMYRNGHYASSDCQRGALVARDNASAQIDFGGGNYGGQPVVGALSVGGNKFCGQGSLMDIWNSTDSCTGAAGASIGARANCFDSVPPAVQDPAPITTATGGYAQCTQAECAFGGVNGPFTLSVNLAGRGEGAVASNPPGINCGTDCAEMWSAAAVVTLTATPGPGSGFTGFAGDADCADGVVTMNGAKACTAVFAPMPPATTTTSAATTTSTSTTSTSTSTTSTSTSTTSPPICLTTGAPCANSNQCCSRRCVHLASVGVCG